MELRSSHLKVACIDLNSTYRQLVHPYFPNTKIVADRFHVTRLMHHMCMQTYQSIDHTIQNKRGLLAGLCTNPDNPTLDRLIRNFGNYRLRVKVLCS